MALLLRQALTLGALIHCRLCQGKPPLCFAEASLLVQCVTPSLESGAQVPAHTAPSSSTPTLGRGGQAEHAALPAARCG